MPLTRNSIVDAALKVVDEHGFDALTTRRIGEALGVEGPAIYRHFESKQAMIDQMGIRLFEPIREMPIDPDWAQHMLNSARATRAAILACRDGARIIAATWPGGVLKLGRLSEPFVTAGFSAREALYAYLVVGRFVIGWTSAEQAFASRVSAPTRLYDEEDAFEFGLETLIAGLRLRLLDLPRRRAPLASAEPAPTGE